MLGIRKHEFHAVLYISCNFIQKCFLLMWYNALPHGVEVAKHSIYLEFWAFHAVSSKIISELGPNTLLRLGNRKHEFCVVLDIPLNFHCECFTRIGTSAPPLVPWDAIAKHQFYIQFWTFWAISSKKHFCKLSPTPQPRVWGCEHDFSGHLIQFLAKLIFWKYPSPSVLLVKGEGSENVTFLHKSCNL